MFSFEDSIRGSCLLKPYYSCKIISRRESTSRPKRPFLLLQKKKNIYIYIDTLPLLLSSCLHTSAKQNTIEAETLGDSCQMAAIFHSRLKLFSLEKKTSEKNRRRSCRHRVTGAARRHTAALRRRRRYCGDLGSLLSSCCNFGDVCYVVL